jgi:hypothetical protein
MPEEQKAKVSSSRKGKGLGNTNGFKRGQEPWNKGDGSYMAGELNPYFGKTHSPEVRAKIKAKAIGRPAWNRGLKIGPSWQTGLTKETDERVARMAEGRNRRLRAGEISLGGKANPSSLSWTLVDFLSNAGFDNIVLEEKFGPYSVDVLLADEWLAFEADGEYWHEKNKTDYDARDRYLLENFGLPVVRLAEAEIREVRQGEQRYG